MFRRIHKQLGGELKLLVSAGAYLPPALQESWQDLGVIVLQGYGATECGPAAATTEQDHPTLTVGKTLPPVEVKLEEGSNEILVRGPTVFDGYWKDPDATAAVMSDGWYRTGDVGRYDGRGNLVLSGRTKNIIVLPNGLNVFPEDIENALQAVGLDRLWSETAPGRFEAVVLSPDAPPMVTPNDPAPAAPQTDDEAAALRKRIEPLIKAANSRLSQHQRIDDFRVWPEADFPRTHTSRSSVSKSRMGWCRRPAGVPGVRVGRRSGVHCHMRPRQAFRSRFVGFVAICVHHERLAPQAGHESPISRLDNAWSTRAAS